MPKTTISTIGDEKENNAAFKIKDRNQFIKFIMEKTSNQPKQYLP